MLEMLLNGFQSVFTLSNMLYLLIGVLLGLIMGAIPGLTATMAIALMVPLTFSLTATQSIVMLLGCFNAGTFGGSLSAILLATPGTPAAAATVADGYALAKQGKGAKAIKTALFSSVFGGLLSCLILTFVAEPIAKYALKFGPGEYTVLMIFAMTIIASAAGTSMIRGLIAGFLGMLFGCVGFDIVESIPRFSFGSLKLSSGLDTVVVLIGALALSEILVQVEGVARGKKNAHLPPATCKDDETFGKRDLKRVWKTWIKSSLLGAGIGALPCLGCGLACYVGYDAAKRSSKHPEEFGKGSIEGVAAAESANNAVCGANMIPLLSLGVPGDTATAILMGAFLIQGLTPGPLIFRESPQTVYNIYAGLIVANLALLVIVLLTYKQITRMVSKLKTTVIFPVVCTFCIIGVYAVNQSLEDVWIMLFFAVLGYIMHKLKFPMACLLIGFILAPILEKNFRQAMLISGGSTSIFFGSVLCWVFWALTIFSVFTILRSRRKSKKEEKSVIAEAINEEDKQLADE